MHSHFYWTEINTTIHRICSMSAYMLVEVKYINALIK